MLPLNYYFALPYCSLCKLAFLNIIPSIQTSEIGGKTLKLYFSVLHNVIAHKTSPPITKAGCWNEHYSFVIRLVFFFFFFHGFIFSYIYLLGCIVRMGSLHQWKRVSKWLLETGIQALVLLVQNMCEFGILVLISADGSILILL